MSASDATRVHDLIEDIERLIDANCSRIKVSGEVRQELAGVAHAEFDRLMATESAELTHLADARDRLD